MTKPSATVSPYGQHATRYRPYTCGVKRWVRSLGLGGTLGTLGTFLRVRWSEPDLRLWLPIDNVP
jgi:hypothetical protein